MVPGGLEVLERKCQLESQHPRMGGFYLQIIDDTRHALDLVADGARNILENTN